MLLLMFVALYTSRVVINILGIDDFGTYNIIGGIVVLFSFLNNALTTASQRFFSYELGRQKGNLSEVFGSSLVCHIVVALIVIVIAETVGLWFVNTRLNIPPDRFIAAKWVYQFTILTFVLNILRIPYHSIIIAYEKMSIYAYISIIEAFFKLGMVFMLRAIPFDRLILYAALMAVVPLLCNMIYMLYCKKKFDCCKKVIVPKNSQAYKTLFSFFGWSMLGGAANVSAQQGGNILINIFHGVALNAGFGVANQASHAVSTFVNNFQLAFNPHLVKLYAQNKIEELNTLIMRTSLFSFYLIWILSLPLMLNMHFVLELWLKTVPPYAESFCMMMLIYYLIDAIQAPLFMTIYATGNIKNYQIWLSALIVMNIPISWLLLRAGYSPTSVLFTRMMINLLTAIIRTFYIRRLIPFHTKDYLINVCLRSLLVVIISALPLILIQRHVSINNLVMILVSVALTGITIWIIGLSGDERQQLKEFAYAFVSRHK